MTQRCLYCYQPLAEAADYHTKCSLEFFGTAAPPALRYTIQDMEVLAKEVVERSVAVPGVQAKLSMSVVREAAGQTDGRLTVVGALGGNFILKPPSPDYPEMPANEHVTMRIAESFRMSTVPSSLIRLASGELAYITKRIDRTEDNQKIHMLDMYQITEASDKYRSSMERVGKAVATYSDDTLLDLVNLFELTLFCFLTGNNDMHLKNFSLIRSGKGWKLSPAYDLLNVTILNPGDTEELALTLEARKKKLSRDNFERFGTSVGLSPRQVNGVFKRLLRNRPQIESWLSRSFLSAGQQEAYLKVANERYARLYK
jgi:serine/threonine-protein kinase HipA